MHPQPLHCLCRLMCRQPRLSQHVTSLLAAFHIGSRAVTQHATLELHLFQTCLWPELPADHSASQPPASKKGRVLNSGLYRTLMWRCTPHVSDAASRLRQLTQ